MRACVCSRMISCVASFIAACVHQLQEFNKLRVTALTYCSPELLNVMVELLETEKEAMSQPRGSVLLEKAINFLRTSTDASKKLSSGGNIV